MPVPSACPEEAQAETRPVEDPRTTKCSNQLKVSVPAIEATIASGLQAITPDDPSFQNVYESISLIHQRMCKDQIQDPEFLF